MANILIVDDSETVRVQLKADLVSEGHTVFEAANGLDGIKMMEGNQHNIALIFCDVNMPEMDGLTMSRELRKIPELAKVPIFMLTTQTSVTMKAEGKAAGVMAWIIKPYEKRKVMSGVAKVLSGQAS
ncbi:MAG: response regulator [Rhodocyclaceae bacterium]|nr:response regulator [Rhodocyclaceae bacterium]